MNAIDIGGRSIIKREVPRVLLWRGRDHDGKNVKKKTVEVTEMAREIDQWICVLRCWTEEAGLGLI